MTDTRGETRRPAYKTPTLLDAFVVQCRVIGAIVMRELHTRYGRDNIGYLWLIGEPLIFGSAIAVMHGIRSGGDEQNGVGAVAMGTTGYAIFIIFRSIVTRSDGALASNQPLLQHKMVTILDIIVARALLEVTGCFCSFLLLSTVIHTLGMEALPERPLYVLLGIFYVFWLALGLGMIITGLSYERPVIERLIHPMTYFMMPLSGAFFMAEWLPEGGRNLLLLFPLLPAFEIVRYGMFANCTLDYVDFLYLTTISLSLTLLGLLSLNTVKNRLIG